MSEHTPEIVTLEPQDAAVLHESVRMDALPDFFGRAFQAAMTAAQSQGIPVVGPPFGLYHGMPTDTVDVSAGFPTARPISPDAGATPGMLPGGRAAQVLHEGSYDSMRETYERLMAWLGEQGLAAGPVMWEQYLNEPDPERPEETRTMIVWPLA